MSQAKTVERAALIGRRDFVRSSFAAGALVATPALLAFDRLKNDRASFRTITYNILACRGYPQRPENEVRLRNARPQIPVRIAQELLLYEPDMVTIQESSPESTMAAIAEAMEMNYAYFPGGFPGTLITPHTIKETVNCPLVGGAARPKDLFTRHWGRAVLDVRGNELIVYSVHLYPGNKEGYQTREVAAMREVIQEDVASGRSMILQGDLNFEPGTDLYAALAATGIVDAYTDDDPGLTFSSTDRRFRIDLIFAHGPISQRVLSCRVLDEGAFIDHPDDLAGFALSDHIPVLAEFDW